MKKEYDFSKGERGKFYKEGAKLNIPIYLEKVVAEFIEKVAKKKENRFSDNCEYNVEK